MADYHFSRLRVVVWIMKAEHLLVLCSCPGTITAKKIANELVAGNLAACVKIIPGVTSIYRWVGKVDTAEEIQLLIKTSKLRYPELESKIKAIHPYDLPEISAIPIVEGYGEYLNWIDSSTKIQEND